MRAVLPAVLVLLLASPAPAGDPPKAIPLSVEALRVQPTELPASVKEVEGIHVVSPHARNWYEKPHPYDLAPPEIRAKFPQKFWDSFPRPTAKGFQSFSCEGGVPGSAFLFEYANSDLGSLRAFLPGDLWGPGGRSDEHPEELIIRDRFVLILSFPRGDPAAEWFKERLRRKFAVKAFRFRRELIPVLDGILRADGYGNPDAGLARIAENEKAVADFAFVHYLRGEYAVGKKDWAMAEKGYRRALELDDTFVDPLKDEIRWASLDGLGCALLSLRRLDEAVKVLAEAWKFAGELKMEPGKCSQSIYNLACAHSLAKRYDAALKALRDAIAADPKWKEKAREDSDLAEARKRRDFEDLLR